METIAESTGQVQYTGRNYLICCFLLVKKLIPILAAIALSSLMLFGFFTSLSFAASTNTVFLDSFDYGIDLQTAPMNNPSKFTVGDNNFYIVDVYGKFNKNDPKPQVSVNIDNQLSVIEMTGDGWLCTSQGAIINCSYQKALSNDTGINSISIKVNVPSDISNINILATAVVTPTDDTNPGNNSREKKTTIDSADLALIKKVKPQYSDVGVPVEYTYIVKNNGPAKAIGVKIIDKLPLGVDFPNIHNVTSGPFTGTFKLNKPTMIGTWTLSNINKGETITVTLPATATNSVLGKKLINSAQVKSDNLSDWQSSNDSSSTDFFVSGLQIEKRLDPRLAQRPIEARVIYVGEPFIYTIIVTNTGQTSAKQVYVTDAFARGLDIISARYTNDKVNWSPFSTGNSMSKYFSEIGPNVAYTIEVNVRGNKTITNTETITNQAFVKSKEVIRESEVVTVTQIRPAADFYVTTNDGVKEVTPNQVVTYTVTVQNIGSVITHTNFVVTDTLAAYLDFVRLDLGTLIYTPTFISSDNLTHVWRFGELLDPSEAISYRITGQVKSNAPTSQSTLHRVVVRSPDEKYLGNNIAEDLNKIVVQPITNFNFNLTIDRKRVEVGEGIHFLITLENIGDTIPVNARVTDVFPAVLDIVDAKTTFGTLNINASTRTVTVDLGSFGKGRKILISITTKVNSSATTSAVYDHKSALTYNPNVTIESNTVKFSIIAGGGILPGTGLGPPAHYADARASSPALWLLPFALLLPLILLGRRWARIPPA